METKASENIIELKGIRKIYEDNFEAVKDFNLQVKKGEFVTFLGPSGCGKTTTLRMIAGFDIPTYGQILLNGKISASFHQIRDQSIPCSSVMPFSHI